MAAASVSHVNRSRAMDEPFYNQLPGRFQGRDCPSIDAPGEQLKDVLA
jgi:hypothetical protein